MDKQAKRILVGVDCTRDGKLTKPSLQAVEEASFWAKEWNSSICFAHFLEVPQSFWMRMTETGGSALEAIRGSMQNLVDSATGVGLRAHYRLERGKPWMELIYEVQREGFGLVFAGSASPNSLARAVFGSTTSKLVRKCPVPVWITKTEATPSESGCILAAHDLKETGETGLRYAVTIARRLGVALKVIHALELPELTGFFTTVPSGKLAEEKQIARQRIESQLRECEFDGDYQIDLEIAPAAPVVLRVLKEESVRLLVMGSVGRSGVPGLLVGNTAEALLPWIPCSTLVVKPEAFATPVSLPLDR